MKREVIDEDHHACTIVEPVEIRLLHDFVFARIYLMSAGRHVERVTIDWTGGDVAGEKRLEKFATEFAWERLDGWLSVRCFSNYGFVGRGRIAFAHACDALLFDLLWTRSVSRA